MDVNSDSAVEIAASNAFFVAVDGFDGPAPVYAIPEEVTVDDVPSPTTTEAVSHSLAYTNVYPMIEVPPTPP